jgi:hypothetical protein
MAAGVGVSGYSVVFGFLAFVNTQQIEPQNMFV